MNKEFYQTQAFTFLTILIVGTACSGQVKKDPDTHLKLIKTIGSPRYGNVQCGLQDKAGNLWFGTTENGLYKYDGKSFAQFLVADGLNSNTIYSIFEDKEGRIWIGTTGGVCLYDASLPDSQGKTFSKINIPVPKNLPPNTNPLHKTQYVFSIIQAKSGELWFATIDGVYIYDGKSLPTGQAAFTPFMITGATGGYLTSNTDAEHLLEDKAGNIWFGGRGNEGVFRYDGKSVVNIKIKEPGPIRSDSDRIQNDWAWPQLQDKNGNIWFSNWGGAYRYDGKSFTTFSNKDGLSGDMVAEITEDKKGNLWFGGAGLSLYDGKSFTRFTTNDGLPNLGVWSILEDKTGNIWVGTRETGLYMYDGKKFITYSEYKQPAAD